MRFPDFIPAKRGAAPNLTQAAIYQGVGDRAQYEQEQQKRAAQLRGPVDAYKGYVDLTDHNPLADQVRKWTGKGGAETGTATQGVPTGAPPPPPAASPTPPVAGGPAGMETSNLVAGLGQGAMNAGSNAGIQSLQGLTAGQAGQQMSTMLPKVTEVAGGEVAGKMGSAAMGAAGGAVTGGALSGLMESQNPYTNNERIAVKGGGGAATGALMASAPALAAAGPVGWAGIAGLAALSLYGMLV